MRRLLLLVWVALLLLGGIGSDVAERCAAFAPRACCCKASTPSHGAALRRSCACGCKVDAQTPAPARVAMRPNPEREPVARLADSSFASVRMPVLHPFDPTCRRERPRGDPLRLDLFCVWRI